MNVVFVEPFFPSNQRQFARALAEAGAAVIGIGEYPPDALDEQLKNWLYHYERVPSVTDVEAMTAAVHSVQDRRLDRPARGDRRGAYAARRAGQGGLLDPGHVGAHGMAVPGQAVDEAGAARCRGADGRVGRGEQRRRGARLRRADRVPADPQAAQWRRSARHNRVDDAAAVDQALGVFGGQGVDSIAVEEFVEGHEGFYDTIAIGGQVAMDFVSHYYPNVLEAMRTRWISPQFISTNRIDTGPEYAELRDMGRRVIAALGITTSATHMEWFFGPRGLRFSEIGCRPPGVGAWDLYSAGNDLDTYREWANAIVHGHTSAAPSRRHASGMIALRPDRDGSISGYSGVDELQQRYGEWVIDAHLPEQGTPTQPVAAGYMANAYVRMRHPDYDTLRGMLDDVGRTLHVHAQ